jgi:uncharacterized protein (TIGR02217 family)
MTHHNDVILDKRVRFGSGTEVQRGQTQLFAASGDRHVNTIWAEPLRVFRNLYRLELVDIYAIYETYLALNAIEDTGLLRDWIDWNTSTNMQAEHAGSMLTDRVTAFDQPLMNPNLSPITNLGDASTTVFHTYKTYSKGAAATQSFRIRHPVDAGFKLGIGGVDVTATATFSVNEGNGEVTITSPVPGDSPGDTVTWGGEFRRSFHFSDDRIEQILRNRLADSLALSLMEGKNV